MIGPLPPELGGLTAGGVATHTAELVRALARLGVDVRVLATNAAPRASSPALPGITPQRRAAGWSGVCRRALERPSAAWAMARLSLRLAGYRRLPPAWRSGRLALLDQLLEYRAFLHKARPALVHVQHPLDRHLVVRLLGELDDFPWPLVVTLHSFFREHAAETIFGLMQPNLRHADRFIAVSEHVRDEAIQLGAEAGRIRVIRSGVDAERFRPLPRLEARSRLGVPGDDLLVLFVGNLEPRKAVDRLIAAMARVRAALPRAALAIVGSGAAAGADNQEPRLRRQAEALGLGDAVRFVGPVTAEELVRWYNAADVFALPSLSEAQGIVALEAMSCGCPVVASAVGGLVATITDGQNGCLVPPGEVGPLADRVIDLLRDAALRERLGQQARQTVLERFSWEQAARATVTVYRELLQA